MLVMRGWWMGLVPALISLEGGIQNSACQSQYPHGRTSSPKCLLLVLLSQGEPQLYPASPGSSPRWCISSWLISYVYFCLGAQRCDILCVTFKTGVSISYSPLPLPKVSPQSFKTNVLGTCLHGSGHPGWVVIPLTPWGESLQL